MTTQELNIYEVVSSKANGRYFLIDNRVYSHEMSMKTTVTYFTSFNLFLHAFLKKIRSAYDDENRPSDDNYTSIDGNITFKAVYDCDHSSDYYMELNTSVMKEDELRQVVALLNLYAAARQGITNPFDSHTSLKELNATCGTRDIFPPLEKKYGKGKKLIYDALNLAMTIEFLEKGKEPLADYQQKDVIKTFEKEMEEYAPFENQTMDGLYYFFNESEIYFDLEKIETHSCTIGSPAWIDLHKRSMRNLHPNWNGDAIYDCLKPL